MQLQPLCQPFQSFTIFIHRILLTVSAISHHFAHFQVRVEASHPFHIPFHYVPLHLWDGPQGPSSLGSKMIQGSLLQ
jgi:hypothetical protein